MRAISGESDVSKKVDEAERKQRKKLAFIDDKVSLSLTHTYTYTQ